MSVSTVHSIPQSTTLEAVAEKAELGRALCSSGGRAAVRDNRRSGASDDAIGRSRQRSRERADADAAEVDVEGFERLAVGAAWDRELGAALAGGEAAAAEGSPTVEPRSRPSSVWTTGTSP